MENSIQSILPHDVALKIASCLPVRDVCSIGSCSKFWRELCLSDALWISLYKQRWPSINSPSDCSKESYEPNPVFKGWRGFYVKRHNEMESKAQSIVKFVEQNCSSSSSSLEVRDYLEAIDGLCSMQLGLQDVQMFLFRPELTVVLNLVGLHYCIGWLGISPESAMEALQKSNISERQVCVKWWKIGRWFYGFRLKDESRTRCVSLSDIAVAKEEEVLGVLQRGTVYEVIRVQISVVKLPPSVPYWAHSQQSSRP